VSSVVVLAGGMDLVVLAIVDGYSFDRRKERGSPAGDCI
jgi:hypothetical protein